MTACKSVRRARFPWQFQFKLRTLLFAIALFAVVIAVVRHRAEQQRKAVAGIRAAGGYVAYDYQLRGGRLNLSGQSSVPDWARRLFGDDVFRRVVEVSLIRAKADTVTWLEAFPDVELLKLDRAEVTDSSLRIIGSLKHLRELTLFDTEVDDEGLASLQGLTKLECLGLSHTRITNAGICHLRGMVGLQSLGLDSTRVSDEALVHLVQMRQLEALSLSETPIRGVGLKHLKASNLKRLFVERTGLDDAGLAAISELKSLEWLDARNVQCTDEGLRSLGRLPNLRNVSIGSAAVTDVGLGHLKALKSVESLSVACGVITPEAENSLRRALPRASVTVRPLAYSSREKARE